MNKKHSLGYDFIKGLFKENPVLIQLLGLCSVLAVSNCLLYTSPSPRDISGSRMPSSA